MKKLVLGLLGALLMVGLVVGTASAESVIVNDDAYIGPVIQMNAYNADIQVQRIREAQLEGRDAQGNVVKLSDPANLATVLKTNPQGRWCAGPHIFDITTTIDVQNWLYAGISLGTNIDWIVNKPGTYITDCIKLNVHGNTPINVTLENTTDPYNMGGIDNTYMLSRPFNSDDNEVFLALPTAVVPVTQDTETGEPWVSTTATVENIPNHGLYKLWNKIVVPFHTSPGDYAGSAVITVSAAL
ncbi:MAG: hypothetical protein QME81_02730 [bacterium]|nr:hypothetical protein [bacterium]